MEALLCLAKGSGDLPVILTSSFNIKGEDSCMVKDYISDTAKDLFEEALNANGKLTKDEYTVYYSNSFDQGFKCFVFAKGSYNSALAVDCLQKYRGLVQGESQIILKVRKDHGYRLKDADRLLESHTFNKIAETLREVRRMDEFTNQAQRNLVMTLDTKQKSDDLLYYTKQMNKNTSDIGDNIKGKDKKKNCLIF